MFIVGLLSRGLRFEIGMHGGLGCIVVLQAIVIETALLIGPLNDVYEAFVAVDVYFHA